MSTDWEAIRAEERRLVALVENVLNLGVSDGVSFNSRVFMSALNSLPADIIRAVVDLRHAIYQQAQSVVA